MILASKSPRRKEILGNVGFKLKIVSADVDEISNKTDNIEKIMDIAYKKTVAVANNYEEHFVVGADTIVELDGEIIGKPRDEEDAKSILQRLSGKSHRVITGYCLINLSLIHI